MDIRPAQSRATTGVPGLDPLIEGGFPDNRVIAVCGGAGTGKTTFALQFVAHGMGIGESAVLLCVDEKPRHILESAASLGLDLQEPLTRGQLLVLDAAPYFTATRGRNWMGSGLDARDVASDLAQQIRKIGARRVAIDSITSLVPPEMEGAHTHDYLRSVVQSLEDNLNCSILMTCRSSGADRQGSGFAMRALASGVLELGFRRHGTKLTRTLTLRKMRCTQFEPAEYPVTIDEGGVAVQHDAAGFPAVTRVNKPIHAV